MSKNVILTREQMNCVNYKGDIATDLVVKGIAGSGKSLVLMKRAQKYLEEPSSNSNHVIMFCYNNTLATYLEEQFGAINKHNHSFRVCTLDSYLLELFNAMPGHFWRKYVSGSPQNSGNILNISMKDALTYHKKKNGPHRFHDLPVEFWREECKWIKDMDIAPGEKQKYLSIERKGRGGKVKMSAEDREVAFEIFEEYCNVLEKKKCCEYEDIHLFISHNLHKIPDKFKYNYVLVDEAQDHSLTKMKIVASLSMKAATIAMDGNQKIYRNNWKISNIGLKSITRNLPVGFRCSPQVDALAESLRAHNNVAGEEFENEHGKPIGSNGPLPLIYELKNDAQQKELLTTLVKDMLKKDPGSTIGILFSTNYRGKQIASWLSDKSIPFQLIKKEQSFSVTAPGVKLSTVHSAKGLEFNHVIVTDFNEGVYPNLHDVSDAELVEEEMIRYRNLAYVAFTRARDMLIIMCHTEPSRFIDEMDSSLYQYVNGMHKKSGTSDIKKSLKPVEKPENEDKPKIHPPITEPEMIVENRDWVHVINQADGKATKIYVDTKIRPHHSTIIGKKVNDIFVIRDKTYKITKIEGPQTKTGTTPIVERESLTYPSLKTKKSLIQYFTENNFEVIDKRKNNGCLWIIAGEKEGAPYMRQAERLFNVKISYAPRGGGATGHVPAWWTTANK